MASSPTETDTPFKDYYEVLNLHPQADAAMLDQAYWHLARIHNAAIASDSGAGERLEELNEAYSVLRSAALRREYDKVRDAVLGEGASPEPPQAEEAEPEPPPLTVMEKQRPRPREESMAESHSPREEPKKKRFRRPRIRIRRVRIPSWQGAGSALAILALGGAALANGANPVLVVPLLILGVVLAVVPLMREMPRLPQLPAPNLRLPSVRAPRLPERSHPPSVDPDSLRQSTEAMLARWRVSTEGVSGAESDPSPLSSEPAPDPQQGDGLAGE